jgi:hypothetical protein
MAERCGEDWSGIHCQLRAGHQSAHAARVDGALYTFVHPYWGNRIELDWAETEDEG